MRVGGSIERSQMRVAKNLPAPSQTVRLVTNTKTHLVSYYGLYGYGPYGYGLYSYGLCSYGNIGTHLVCQLRPI